MDDSRDLLNEQAKRKIQKPNLWAKEGYEEILNENYPLNITKMSSKTDECCITIGTQMCVPIIFKNEKEAQKYIDSKPYSLYFGIMLTTLSITENKKK